MWEMSSTTELGVELAEDPEPRPPNPRPSLIPIPTKYNKYFPVWTPEAIDNIFTAFSSLYAVIVITVFLAFSFTEIVTFPHLHNHLEKSGFFVYLYTISIIFYGYLFFVVSIRDKELGLASELKVVFNHKVKTARQLWICELFQGWFLSKPKESWKLAGTDWGDHLWVGDLDLLFAGNIGFLRVRIRISMSLSGSGSYVLHGDHFCRPSSHVDLSLSQIESPHHKFCRQVNQFRSLSIVLPR